MKIWILVAIAGLLLVWSLTRERFTSPPPVCPTGTILDSTNKCVGESVVDFTCPAGFEPKGSKCRRTGGGGGSRTVDPVCPVGTEFSKDVNACRAAPRDPTCPGGYEFKNGACALKPGSTPTMTPSLPPPTGLSDRDALAAGLAAALASGVSKNDERVVAALSARNASGGFPASSAITSSFSVETPIPAEARTRTLAETRTMAGFGPTTGCPPGFEVRDGTCKPKTEASGGPSDRQRQVFGPLFTMRGPSGGGDGGDSSKTNMYPELLGGGKTASGDKTSRQPGDMDLIPDPYRISRTFSQASYSSKTEPTPFLTDFSAFLK